MFRYNFKHLFAILVVFSTFIICTSVSAFSYGSGLYGSSLYSESLPIINNVSVYPSNNSAQISINTSKLTSVIVSYRINGNNFNEVNSPALSLSHDIELNDLLSCTTYNYDVKVTDFYSNEVDMLDQAFTTTGCAASSSASKSSNLQIDKTLGGSLSLKDDNFKGLTLSVPTYFSTSSANFQVHKLDKESVLNVILTPNNLTSVGDHVYELKAFSSLSDVISVFDSPLTVSIDYNAEDIIALNESSLKIYRWDDGVWTRLNNCVVNTNEKKVSCETSHFSVFSLFGEEEIEETPELVDENSFNNNFITGYTNPPIAPVNGFKIITNNITTESIVKLSFVVGDDVSKIAISNHSDFRNASLDDYAQNKDWNICTGLTSCNYGPRTIYVKFYTKYGVSSDVIKETVDYQQSLEETSLDEKTNNVTNEEIKLTLKPDDKLIKRLAGKILLQVENFGQAWYLDNVSLQRYYLADGKKAYDALRKFGLGITNTDLSKIPVSSQSILPDDYVKSSSYSSQLTNRLLGRIVLQVENNGEAWYVNPSDGHRYYLANGEAAYQIMRSLSLGISNNDIRKIMVGSW